MKKKTILSFVLLLVGVTVLSAYPQEVWDKAVAFYQQGVENFKNREYDEAFDAFYECLDLMPDDFSAHYMLGLTYYAVATLDTKDPYFSGKFQSEIRKEQQSSLEFAIEKFMEALKFDKDEELSREMIYTYIASSYILLPFQDTKVKEFTRLILKINPDNPDALRFWKMLDKSC